MADPPSSRASPLPHWFCRVFKDIVLPYRRHSAPILPSSPNWAFFLRRLAGILGRPFPWCRPPLCFAP
ncbi:hypothetical protein C9382_31040 [Pseudomonas aylmerensis]|uniref:Uncharacterized protein n=1 Tax=Pseudomonas aylmerensis TaxID=1869229 RepID=A0A2T4FIM1_9PSED|nr:hypothetical protein DXV65_01645 [Pseudomonas fluorescens]PTC23266.1 hypothetical protein C9382_31040 [Pseudomonas aylmerensis]